MSHDDHLSPCGACGRHVRATDDLCPFCDAPFTAPPRAPVRRVPRASLTRAAVVLGAALAASGCGGGGNDPGAQRALYGGPPPDRQQQTQGDETSDADGTGDADPDGADDGPPDESMVMPYGAPSLAAEWV